jgi:hypothetical protein
MGEVCVDVVVAGMVVTVPWITDLTILGVELLEPELQPPRVEPNSTPNNTTRVEYK